ncbi:MAG: hypothetical protein LBD35_07040 [Prevotellaceae bacterium]|jgi:hypothetical protein|nr:hypothetical protein [Prevotellaceae bacterium]
MNIANPNYDAAFQYMMEDDDVAQDFLSAIFAEKVTRISNYAAGSSRSEKNPIKFLVRRLDYNAKVTMPDGNLRDIIVELHKIKLLSDVPRFRKRIEAYYSNPENGRTFSEGPQVYRLYFFQHSISASDTPVIYSSYEITDSITNEQFSIEDNKFLLSICPRSWFVQIPKLKQPEAEIEQALSIFDRRNLTKNPHIVEVNEENFPKTYLSVIQRLHKASEISSIRLAMEMEDACAIEFGKWESIISEQKKTIAQKDKEIGELKRQLSGTPGKSDKPA